MLPCVFDSLVNLQNGTQGDPRPDEQAIRFPEAKANLPPVVLSSGQTSLSSLANLVRCKNARSCRTLQNPKAPILFCRASLVFISASGRRVAKTGRVLGMKGFGP